MILVDSSVWIGHLRQSDPALARLLDSDQVLTHPLVVGEVAMGNLPRRSEVLALLADLPSAIVASDAEVMGLIERERLFGLGIGFVDVHLLASARLTPSGRLWTLDRRLDEVAHRLGLAST